MYKHDNSNTFYKEQNTKVINNYCLIKNYSRSKQNFKVENQTNRKQLRHKKCKFFLQERSWLLKMLRS